MGGVRPLFAIGIQNPREIMSENGDLGLQETKNDHEACVTCDTRVTPGPDGPGVLNQGTDLQCSKPGFWGRKVRLQENTEASKIQYTSLLLSRLGVWIFSTITLPKLIQSLK